MSSVPPTDRSTHGHENHSLQDQKMQSLGFNKSTKTLSKRATTTETPTFRKAREDTTAFTMSVVRDHPELIIGSGYTSSAFLTKADTKSTATGRLLSTSTRGVTLSAKATNLSGIISSAQEAERSMHPTL